jgi:hypothetical protein
MARIDYQTPTAKQQEYFSDFLSSFDKSPLSSDIARITNENSIKQSIRNLVLTNLGDRMLFEPYTGFTADDLKKDIINTIKQNETRANDISVNVINNEDQNRFTVNIFFFIINNPNQLSLELVLQRVR